MPRTAVCAAVECTGTLHFACTAPADSSSRQSRCHSHCQTDSGPGVFLFKGEPVSSSLAAPSRSLPFAPSSLCLCLCVSETSSHRSQNSHSQLLLLLRWRAAQGAAASSFGSGSSSGSSARLHLLLSCPLSVSRSPSLSVGLCRHPAAVVSGDLLALPPLCGVPLLSGGDGLPLRSFAGSHSLVPFGFASAGCAAAAAETAACSLPVHSSCLFICAAVRSRGTFSQSPPPVPAAATPLPPPFSSSDLQPSQH